MNKTFDDILDDLSAYALTLTDDRLDDLEKDLNKVKEGEGTKKKKAFREARDTLNKARKAFDEYEDTIKPKLLSKAKELVAYFEKLRDTGVGKSKTMAKLGEIEALVADVSPLDDDVLENMRRASTISIRSKTLDHFGDSGSPNRSRIEDKAIEVNRQIKDVWSQGIFAIAQVFSVLDAEITQGVHSLKKRTKVLTEIVKALKTLNTLLAIATRVVGLS